MNENTSSKKIIDDYTTKVRATNEIARSEARNKKREARETPIANVLKSTEEMPVQQRQITTEETPVQQRQKPQSVWNELGGLALKIALISIAFFLIFTFVYGFHRTTDSDMSPMIRTGDLVLFYRLNRDYTAGDLLLLDFQGERQVRRVVARAGDIVDFNDGNLVINGAMQQEPEIFQETWQYETGVIFPLTVGEGQVFVLGDAREGASDSRVYGAVDIDDTLGTVITILRRRNF